MLKQRLAFFYHDCNFKLIDNMKKTIENSKICKSCYQRLDCDILPRQEYGKHPRKRYSKPVIFTSMNQLYKGYLSNISGGGAFIETRGQFKAGQIIKFIIPGTKIGEGIKLKGEVQHFNPSELE